MEVLFRFFDYTSDKMPRVSKVANMTCIPSKGDIVCTHQYGRYRVFDVTYHMSFNEKIYDDEMKCEFVAVKMVKD